jgi:hypothetical protein
MEVTSKRNTLSSTVQGLHCAALTADVIQLQSGVT